MHQLDLLAAVVEQRREPAPDPEVELHARVLGVLGVQVVALLVGDHLERQLVVVPQEEAPLGAVRDRRRVLQDLDQRQGVLAPHGHEHARHDREVERHLALVVVAEVLHHVVRPLVRLGEQHPVRVARVDLGAHALQERVRLGQVLAVRPVALVEIRDGVEPEAVEADVEPEAQDVQHLLLHVGVVVVEIRLVREEAVPVVLAAQRIPRPVRRLGVDEDDARLAPARVVVAPDVPVAVRPVAVGAARLEPRMLARGVVHHQVDDHAQPALVRLVDEVLEVVDRPVVGMDVEEVGDVVAAVAQRAREARQEPDAVDARATAGSRASR